MTQKFFRNGRWVSAEEVQKLNAIRDEVEVVEEEVEVVKEKVEKKESLIKKILK